MAFQAIYVGADERRFPVRFEAREIAPSGEDIRVVAVVGGKVSYLRASQMAELVDLDSGEIVEDALDYFTRRFLDSRRDRQGRVALAAFIDVLPVEGVGPSTAAVLAAGFGAWDRLWGAVLAAARVWPPEEFGDLPAAPEIEALRGINGVGWGTVEGLVGLALDPVRRGRVERLAQSLSIAPWGCDGARGGALAGLCVVFTGTFEGMSRGEAKSLAEAAGAQVAGSVSGRVDLVVVGSEPGTKLRQARKRGIEVIDEAEFRARLGGD